MPKTLFLALLAFAVLAVGAACGGDDTAAVEEPALPEVDTQAAGEAAGAAADELRAEVDRIEGLVRDQLSSLAEARSLDDVSAQLDEAQSELDQAATDIQEAAADRPEVSEAASDLETALRDLSGQLDEVRAAVEERDLEGALSGLAEVTGDPQRVQSAIDELRSQLDAQMN